MSTSSQIFSTALTTVVVLLIIESIWVVNDLTDKKSKELVESAVINQVKDIPIYPVEPVIVPSISKVTKHNDESNVLSHSPASMIEALPGNIASHDVTDVLIKKKISRKVERKVVEMNIPPAITDQRSLPHDDKVLTTEKASRRKKHSTHISMLQICPATVASSYATVHGGHDSASQLNWCRSQQSAHNVRVGQSWGTLRGDLRDMWESYRCNELLQTGELLPCNDRWGWGKFNKWLQTKQPMIDGPSVSTADCITNLLTSKFCRLTNVTVDFSKARINGGTRHFNPGFVRTYGGSLNEAPPLNGFEHISGDAPKMKCDFWEHRPTFFISHDDIFNIGHHVNDVVAVWEMGVLSGRNLASSLLINMDGIRAGGPAGGPPHRLMVTSDPDTFGPYVG